MSGKLEFIKSATGSDVASVSVTDCFSNKYDVYMVSITKWKYVGTSNAGGFRFIDSGGNVISDAEYDYADIQFRNYAAYQMLRDEGATSILTGIDISSANGLANTTGYTGYIFNPFNSSSYTFANFQDSSCHDTSNLLGYKGIAVHKVAEQITGINFLNRGTGNISATIKVYGVK